jgi:membrane protein
MVILKNLFFVLRDTFTEFNEDAAPRLAAALAYYTAFSIAPLLILLIALVGLVVGQDTVQSEILTQVQGAVGEDGAEIVSDLIEANTRPAQGIVATVIAVVTLLLGALGVFANLQASLDVIWDVEGTKRPGGVVGFVREKLLSFGMLLIVGFLLLVSLVLGTALSALNTYMVGLLPGIEFLLGLVNLVISLVVTTFLFMMLYKFLPHVKLSWRDVAIGAAVTALLFTIGRTLLGLYLANSAPASAYGAAGSFVVILLWVYYSSQILLFGAEFTQVFTRRYNSRLDVIPLPIKKAEPAKPVEAPASPSAKPSNLW